MNVDIDFLIETAEAWIKELEGSGQVEKGIVLLCAVKLFKEQKAKEEQEATE